MEEQQQKGGNYELLKAEIRHLKELLSNKEKEKEKAMELQAKEYERRLDVLNHEHQNIKDNQQKSVLREVYETERDEQNKKIQDLLDWKNNIIGRQVMLLLGWGVAVAVLSIIINSVFFK